MLSHTRIQTNVLLSFDIPLIFNFWYILLVTLIFTKSKLCTDQYCYPC